MLFFFCTAWTCLLEVKHWCFYFCLSPSDWRKNKYLLKIKPILVWNFRHKTVWMLCKREKDPECLALSPLCSTPSSFSPIPEGRSCPGGWCRTAADLLDLLLQVWYRWFLAQRLGLLWGRLLLWGPEPEDEIRWRTPTPCCWALRHLLPLSPYNQTHRIFTQNWLCVEDRQPTWLHSPVCHLRVFGGLQVVFTITGWPLGPTCLGVGLSLWGLRRDFTRFSRFWSLWFVCYK